MRLISDTALTGLLRNLTQDQARTLLSELSTTLAASSKQHADPESKGPLREPLRTVVQTEEGNTRLFMPAADADTTSIKVVTVSERGTIKGTISLFNSDGSLRGLLNAAEITAFRTALASMTLLVRATEISKANIVIFGAGKQSEWHARLAVILFGSEVKQLTFVNRTANRMAALCDGLSQELRDVKIEQISKQDMSEDAYLARLRDVLQRATVIHCCTPSTEPLFTHSDLGQGSKFLSLIGSYKPHMQEIDTETLLSGESGKVYVDSKDACLEEAGEIIKADLGEKSLIELGTVFGAGKESVTAADGKNFIYKCVGMGIMDLSIAKTLLELAIEGGIGQDVEGF